MHKNQQINTKTFELNSIERNTIEREKKCYENSRAVIIEALKVIQKQRGWISDQAIYTIADILKISPSDVESVATFYNGIFRQQVGRHIIRYCDSVVCYITGYQKIQKKIEEELGIISGQTTFDKRFTLLPISCLGNCDKGPTIMIDEDTYGNLSPGMILNLLEQYK